MKNLLLIRSFRYLLSVILLLPLSCKEKERTPEPKPEEPSTHLNDQVVKVNGTPELSENVFYLDSAASGLIREYSDGKLVLSGLTGIKSLSDASLNGRISAVTELRKGFILVGEPSKNAPNGFLVRITNVFQEGSNWIVEYVNSALDEVWKDLSFDAFDFEDIPIAVNLKGFEFALKSAGSGPAVKLKLDGYLNWLFKVRMHDFKIDDFEIQKYGLTVRKLADHHVETDITVGIEGSTDKYPPYLHVTEHYPLAIKEIKQRLLVPTPIGIPFPILVGYTIGLGVQVSIDGSISFTSDLVNMKSESVWGHLHENGKDTKISDYKEEKRSILDPVRVRKIEGEAKMGPAVDFKIRYYDAKVSGWTVSAGLYGKIAGVCKDGKTSIKRFWGMEGKASATLALFSNKPLAAVEITLPIITDTQIGEEMIVEGACVGDEVINQPVDNAVEYAPVAISTGDPHLTTMDGFRYSFMAVGEFVAVKSTVSGDKFEIQARQQQVPSRNNSGTVSFNTGIGIHTGSDQLCIYPDIIYVNGAPIGLPSGTTELRNGGRMVRELNTYTVYTPNNDVIAVRLFQSDLDYSINLNPNRKGKVRGLLGNFDGAAANDLVNAAGQATQNTFPALYPAFARSWRIQQANSLFVYRAGQSTATFTDESFPLKAVALTAAQQSYGRSICEEAGVTDPVILANCIMDVALTEDTRMAERAFTSQEEVSEVRSVSIGDFNKFPSLVGRINVEIQDGALVFPAFANGGTVVINRRIELGKGFEYTLGITGIAEVGQIKCAFAERNEGMGKYFDVSEITFYKNPNGTFNINHPGAKQLEGVKNDIFDGKRHKIRVVVGPEQYYRDINEYKSRYSIYLDDASTPVVDAEFPNSFPEDRDLRGGYYPYIISTGNLKIHDWTIRRR
nr:VWD domain-containing protein [uncultured Dyadobacter sp.]